MRIFPKKHPLTYRISQKNPQNFDNGKQFSVKRGLSVLAIFNLFPNNPLFFTYVSAVQVCIKTLWENEKLLVTSNFSFSYIVFYPFEELSTISSKYRLSSANTFSLEESNLSFITRQF